jgi:hypothetical protein
MDPGEVIVVKLFFFKKKYASETKLWIEVIKEFQKNIFYFGSYILNYAWYIPKSFEW